MAVIIYDTILQLAAKRYGGFNLLDLKAAKCTPAEIEAFALRFDHDFSYARTVPEICKTLKMDAHTVNKLIKSARNRILKHLKETRGKETLYKFNVPIDQAKNFKRLVGERVDMIMQLPGKSQQAISGIIRRVEEKDDKAFIFIGVKQ